MAGYEPDLWLHAAPPAAGILAVRDREDYIWPEPFHVELIKSLRAAMTLLV